MKKQNIVLLIILSAIWGSSFIFMKHLAPKFGPLLTTFYRGLFAFLFLYIILMIQKHKINWKQHYKYFLVIGLINTAIPFALFSFAALHINSSLSAIMNSTSPLFSAMLGGLLLIEEFHSKKIVGLLLGIIGVVIISMNGQENSSDMFVLAIIACLVAALCYAIASLIIKTKATHIDSKSLATGSLFFASVFILFALPFNHGDGSATLIEYGYAVAFGVICSGLAFLIYFKLIREEGATKALSVTYLIPLFGIMWSAIFFQETLSNNTYIGGIIILIGVYFINSKRRNLSQLKTP